MYITMPFIFRIPCSGEQSYAIYRSKRWATLPFRTAGHWSEGAVVVGLAPKYSKAERSESVLSQQVSAFIP